MPLCALQRPKVGPLKGRGRKLPLNREKPGPGPHQGPVSYGAWRFSPLAFLITENSGDRAAALTGVMCEGQASALHF